MLLRTSNLVIVFHCPLSRHCISACPFSHMSLMSRRFASRPSGRSGCALSSAYRLHVSNMCFPRLSVTSNECAPFGSICPGRRTRVAPLSSSVYAGSRTCKCHLRSRKAQFWLILRWSEIKFCWIEITILSTHIFPQEPHFSKPQVVEGFTLNLVVKMPGEVLHALGILAIESNSLLSIGRPFARLENRELLLRLGKDAHHAVC